MKPSLPFHPFPPNLENVSPLLPQGSRLCCPSSSCPGGYLTLNTTPAENTHLSQHLLISDALMHRCYHCSGRRYFEKRGKERLGYGKERKDWQRGERPALSITAKAGLVCLGSEAFGEILTDLPLARLSFLIWEVGVGGSGCTEDVTAPCQTHKATRGHKKLL